MFFGDKCPFVARRSSWTPGKRLVARTSWRENWNGGWRWKDDAKETPKWEDKAKWEDKGNWEREERRRPKRAQPGETDEANRPKKLKESSRFFETADGP